MKPVLLSLSAFLALLLFSCKKEQKPDPAADFPPDAHYFSIRQFAQDQYEMLYKGRPLVLRRLIVYNGDADSGVASVDTLNWGAVLDPFMASDISDRKFLGRYRYSEFDEPLLSTHSLLYEALEPELFTRSLQINADNMNQKITSIIIKTKKNNLEQTLFYAPQSIIQVQERDKPFFGKARNLRLEYRFSEHSDAEGILLGNEGETAAPVPTQP